MAKSILDYIPTKENIVKAGVRSKIKAFAIEAGCMPSEIVAVIRSNDAEGNFTIQLYAGDKYIRDIEVKELF